MKRDYKAVAKELALEVCDIQASLVNSSKEINALLQTLVVIGVITPEQLTRRREDWWEKKAAMSQQPTA